MRKDNAQSCKSLLWNTCNEHQTRAATIWNNKAFMTLKTPRLSQLLHKNGRGHHRIPPHYFYNPRPRHRRDATPSLQPTHRRTSTLAPNCAKPKESMPNTLQPGAPWRRYCESNRIDHLAANRIESALRCDDANAHRIESDDKPKLHRIESDNCAFHAASNRIESASQR